MSHRRSLTAAGRHCGPYAAYLVVVLFCLAAAASPARADGGTVRFSQKRDSYQITVFTSPTPLRVGAVDVSVLVQDAASGKTLRDIPITVHAHPIGEPDQRIFAPATHEAATNKLFRAATLDLVEPGLWHIEVIVGSSLVAFEVEVGEAFPPWLDLSLWIGWPAAAVLLFVVHQLLVQRRLRLSCGKPPPLSANIIGGPR